MAHITIVAAHRHELGQRRGQLHAVGDFVGREACVHQAHGLVVGVFVDVAVFGNKGLDARIAPNRPVVRGDVDLGVGRLRQRLVHIVSPAQGIAHFGAPNREQVVHGLRQVFGAVVQLFRRYGKAQLGRALGVGHVMEHKIHAVDLHGLIGLVNQPGG